MNQTEAFLKSDSDSYLFMSDTVVAASYYSSPLLLFDVSVEKRG